MKNPTFQYHPNQEDKSGNPAFGSNAKLNFSTNEPRATEPAHTTQSESQSRTFKNWLNQIVRRKKSLK